jgi:hypothetical protein
VEAKKKPARNRRPAKKAADDATSAPASAPTAETAPAEAAPAATAEAKPAKPRKPKAPPKPVDLATVGLKLIETSAEKVKSVSVAEPAAPKGPRKAAPWQQKKSVAKNAEPLVMVETQKDRK